MIKTPVRGVLAGVALLSGLLSLSGSSPAPAAAQASQQRLPYVPGELIVTYRDGSSSLQAGLAARNVGAVATQSLSTSEAVQRLRLMNGTDMEAAARALAANPAVATVQPNYIYRAYGTPNDPHFGAGSLWGLRNTGLQGGVAGTDINASAAWDLHTGSEAVVVAVIDTGVDYNHEDLRANMWTNPGEIPGNRRDDDGNGYVDDIHGWDALDEDGDPMDDDGHGTHVAGTIGATGNNGIGVAGVNWNVRIVATRFLDAAGNGTTAGAVASLDYIHKLKDSGVNVVATNNSWGGSGYDAALKAAIERSQSRGILFVAAAGNGDAAGRAVNSDANPQFPASFPMDNVLSVTATDRRGQMAPWANYGRTSIDVGAPGVDILSTVPGNGYALFSGTSMATPFVAGAVALLAANDDSLSPAQLKARLLTSGVPMGALNGKTVTGRGLNLYNALVQPKPPVAPRLTVTVSTDKPTYRLGEYVRLVVSVQQNGQGVPGVMLPFSIRTARGGRFARTLTTDRNGQARLNYRPAKADGLGLYSVSVTTAKSGYESATGAASFEVTPAATRRR